MSTLAIQSMVNCGSAATTVSGFEHIQWSTNGTDWTSVRITGWLPFKEWLSTFSAALPSRLTLEYLEDTDRCRITVTGGITYHVKWSASTAKLLGFNDVQIATGGNNKSGDFGPFGMVPLTGAHYANPRPARQTTPRTFRHGVTHSTAFGSGTLYDVRVSLAHANRERLQEGPSSIGKIRVGEWGASSPYSSAALDGFLDCYLVQQPEISHADLVESHVDAAFIALAPSSAHSSTEALDCAVFGSLRRGWSWNFYCRIEGLPYVFCEFDPGFTSSAYSNHATSATLVISDSTTLTQKVERKAGTMASTGMSFGILDPDGSLGLFKRPTLKISLGADMAHDATVATIDTDTGATSDWPAGGSATGNFYIGKEWVSYSGASSTQFTGLSRGQVGEVYSYQASGAGPYRVLSNAPQVWQGRIAEVWAMAVDPMGNCPSTDWDDAFCRQLFCGEISALPGYDAGVWVIKCSDLIRRLDRSPGTPATGKIAAQVAPGDFGSTLVHIPSTSELGFIFNLWTSSNKAKESLVGVTGAALLQQIGAFGGSTSDGYVELRSLINAIFWKVHNHTPSWSGYPSGFELLIGAHAAFSFGALGGAFENTDDGIKFSVVAHNKSDPSSTHYNVKAGVGFFSDIANQAGESADLFSLWLTTEEIEAGSHGETSADMTPLVSGKSA